MPFTVETILDLLLDVGPYLAPAADLLLILAYAGRFVSRLRRTKRPPGNDAGRSRSTVKRQTIPTQAVDPGVPNGSFQGGYPWYARARVVANFRRAKATRSGAYPGAQKVCVGVPRAGGGVARISRPPIRP
jgi:hypothetical protein